MRMWRVTPRPPPHPAFLQVRSRGAPVAGPEQAHRVVLRRPVSLPTARRSDPQPGAMLLRRDEYTGRIKRLGRDRTDPGRPGPGPRRHDHRRPCTPRCPAPGWTTRTGWTRGRLGVAPPRSAPISRTGGDEFGPTTESYRGPRLHRPGEPAGDRPGPGHPEGGAMPTALGHRTQPPPTNRAAVPAARHLREPHCGHTPSAPETPARERTWPSPAPRASERPDQQGGTRP